MHDFVFFLLIFFVGLLLNAPVGDMGGNENAIELRSDVEKESHVHHGLHVDRGQVANSLPMFILRTFHRPMRMLAFHRLLIFHRFL